MLLQISIEFFDEQIVLATHQPVAVADTVLGIENVI
jgi:hypothetical protein